MIDDEKKIINNSLNINIFTFMPSIYGDCRLKSISSENDVKICNEDDYFNYIKEEINRRSNNKAGVKRPVLVFF
jgi:hypothetical protein